MRVGEIADAMYLSYSAVQRRLYSAAGTLCDPGRATSAALVHRCLTYGVISRPQPIPSVTLTLNEWTVLHCAAWGTSVTQLAEETAVVSSTMHGCGRRLRKQLGAVTLAHAVYLGWAGGILGGLVPR
ncbi:hypothetical protein [Streptomyces sp. NPDC055036]